MEILIENCLLPDGTLGSIGVEGGSISSVAPIPHPEISAPTVIDANGASVIPGLADTHCHPFEYGHLKRAVDLRGASNFTGLRLRLSAGVRRAAPGEWVTGTGWDQEAMAEGRMPTRFDIDDLTGTNPIVLTRICGHIALLNSVAVRKLGLEDRYGPEFQRGTDGTLTGIVKEGALTQVFADIPRTSEGCAQDLLSAEFEAARNGLTAIHCIMSEDGFMQELEAIVALGAQGSLALRYSLYVPPAAVPYIEERGIKGKLVGTSASIEGVKIYADGSLGARTAALREPYDDDPANSGILRHSDEELAELVERADSQGYRVAVHAIGDAAVEQAVSAISVVSGAGNPRGHRIEHASLLPPDLKQKMSKHSIRATVQPLFITSDSWAEKRLGEERAGYLYPLRSMFDSGIIASGSSDAPVESISPVLGIWASMTRGQFAPRESLDLEQAMKLYTSNARLNALESPTSISEGKPADLTLLDSDIRGMHPALLRKVGVSLTLVGGSIAHSSGTA